METETPEVFSSVISRNISIEGDFQSHEHLKIEGQLKGSVKIDGDLHLAETGTVNADVHANNVIIKGSVNGNVYARGHLEIHPSGKMIGDISAMSIDFKEGSSFEGRSRMIKTGTI